MTAVWLMAGLLALLLGGEALVRGGVSLATRLGVSPLLVGLTFVGFGTSTPELVTSVEAARSGSPGIAVGNVVGSNTANILLILGLAALIRPIAVTPGAFRRDGSVLVVSTLLCITLTLVGSMGRLAGGAFVALLVGYVVWTVRIERRRPDASAALHESEAAFARPTPGGAWVAGITLLLGLALTIGGARVLVSAAIELAGGIGISETVVGLTLVAVGTSLPELATSAMAAWRGQSDVALGNVVGSNIYNVLGVLGATALLQPLSVPPQIARVDIWVLLLVTLALVAGVLAVGRLSRRTGVLMLAGYGAYVAWLVAGAG